MKISNSKEEVIKLKKDSIRFLNNTLEYYINNDNLKKAQLISKWTKEFSNYVRFEEKFNPTRNIAYKRGDIVKINFGFNIGSELGGVHYAVVVDNDNKHSANTLVVIPMSSDKPNSRISPHDLPIGSEFYNTLKANVTQKHKSNALEAERITDLLKVLFKTLLSLQEASQSNTFSIPQTTILELENQVNALKEEANELKEKNLFVEKSLTELELMKTGSILKIDQIRAISKMRIWDPKHTQDILYGIHLSDSTMEKVSQKIIELFTHRYIKSN